MRNKKYGETAGIQYTSNAFFAICYSATKNALDWVAFGLDYILDQVDFLMKSLGTPHALAVDELYLIMKLAQGQYLCVVTLALLLYKKSSFLFDFHSCTSDNNLAVNGQVILLKLVHIRDVNNFVITFSKRVI